MTFTPALFVSLTYTAMTMVLHCKADQHPPPTGLTYEWLDGFTVNVSWKKPSGLPDNSAIKFLVKMNKKFECLSQTNSRKSFLTEEMDSDHWMCDIWTVSDCPLSNDSIPATINIYPRKPRAELVKDFKCFVYVKNMNCSWIPANPSLNLKLTYRIRGRLDDSIKSLKKCDQPYSSGERNGCNLDIDTSAEDICILVETEAVMSTFKPLLVVSPPKLTIREERDYLKLNLKPPISSISRCWTFEVCYKQCNKPKECQNTSSGELTMKVSYDKRCLYEFQSRTRATSSCFNSLVSSHFGEPVTYGTNKHPDRTLTVVAIVIPIILSICVILSCYCFRKHSAIFFPIIPDPSAIFKEMMMNGNKELKTMSGSLYMPVPEPIEPCKIILVPENNVLQQNS